jgi:hypothetical protein
MHTLAGLVDTHAAAQTALARTNISVVGRPLPVVQALLRTALRAPTPAERAGGTPCCAACACATAPSRWSCWPR